MSEQPTKDAMFITLGDALPREMARVRDEILPLYQQIGPPGMFGAMMIQTDLNNAARALAEQDTVEMLRIYQVLKETQG
jgi:hypothetical protein